MSCLKQINVEEFANEFIFTTAADILLQSVHDGELRTPHPGYILSRKFSFDYTHSINNQHS